jgi:hypothetical protein
VCWNTLRRAALLAVLTAGLSGCGERGPRPHPARGQVVFPTGAPVRVGTVELKSREHGVQARGQIQQDGSFVLTTYRDGDGAVAGLHDCVVVQMVMVEGVSGHNPSKFGVVHPRFAAYSTSKLQVEVLAGQPNELRIEVEGVIKTKPGDEDKPHGH